MKKILLVTMLAVALLGLGAGAESHELSLPEQAAIAKISPDSLKENLTYLASEALEGRGTPSPGLDLAADYIAEHFRRAGLEPVTPGGNYFEEAPFAQITPHEENFSLSLISGKTSVTVPVKQVRITSDKALDLTHEPILRLPPNGAIPAVAGRVVAGEVSRYGDEATLADLSSRGPSLILLFGKSRFGAETQPYLEDATILHPPVLRIHDTDAVSLLRGTMGIHADARISLHVAEPGRRDFKLHNVAALLPGSDPVLGHQYVFVTAHYDHLGKDAKGYFPGANDDGSGTVSVMEIAAALAKLNPRPRRSIIFMTVFGEEKGLLGSYYYVAHPLVPLRDTVADINLEQMGRTDDSRGANLNAMFFTGPEYSDLTATLSTAAKVEGVTLRNRNDADDYFARSDNYSFALHGVVAHTIAVVFDYPDYHKQTDTPDKIDYRNMAQVDRGVAAGVLAVANDAARPAWSDSKAAGVYREAR